MANSLEILRLNYLGYTQRMIESTVHCSRHTVRQALDEAAEKNITWSLNDDITNEDLEKTRFPGKYKITNMYEQHKTRSCSTWVSLCNSSFCIRYPLESVGSSRMRQPSIKFALSIIKV